MGEMFSAVLHNMLLIALPVVGILTIVSLLRDRSHNKDIRKNKEQQAARVYVENLANQMTYKIQNGIPLNDIENVCNNKNYSSTKIRNTQIPVTVVSRIITDEDKLRIAYNQYLEVLLMEYNKGNLRYDEYNLRLKKLNRRFDELLRQLRKTNWINWRG